MTKIFRQVCWMEGTSFLVLLGIAMPLKYLGGMPEAVMYVGWAHGLLFMAYVYCAFVVSRQHNWPLSRLATALVASVLPFGPFWFDHHTRPGRG